MDSIAINNKNYVNADYVLKNAPIYSKGVRSSRDLIRKKNINCDNFIYSKFENNSWIVSNGKSVKFDKVFILENFVKTIPEIKNILNDENEKIMDENGIEKAPDIIMLDDNEKLKDNEGNVLDIEVRGIRDVDKIYFKVKDVEIGFVMYQLENTLLDSRNENSYKKGIHYNHFIVNKHDIIRHVPSKENNKPEIHKTLFLTYEGLLRVLFVSKNNKTTKFIKWAVNTLFTVHLGNEIQKDTLISKMKGVSYASIQELFNVNSKALPCVYLTYFNDVKTLRTIMNIEDKYNDTDCVYKFGLTTSFENRKYGHKQEFKDIENNIEFKLVQFAFIDPLYLSKAESDIKKLFEENIINYKNHSEIIVLSKKELQFIKNAYELIATKYSGHNTELLKENEKLNNDIKFMNLHNEQNILNIINEHKLKCENIIKEHDIKCENIIKNKDIECNYKIELLKKDFEITLLKKELEYMKPVKSSKKELQFTRPIKKL